MEFTDKQIRYFGKKKECGQNPYIGFVSFQHFRNDRLYSDIIVRPENNMTETEKVECYPIPEDVEQNGWEQGFYPDCTVAYFRILWKEFEPKQGEYNFEIIESILRQASEGGQTVMFRLLPHSTRESDDVPEWLKALIPCPERPAGKRVKDSPTHPAYLQLFGKAMEQIANRFDDDPIFDVVDCCLPGSWGEGHNLHLYAQEDLMAHMDVYTDNFRNTNLIGQVAAPELVCYANQSKPVGWRGDGTGEWEHMHIKFPNAEAKMSSVWEKAPVSFESYYWLGEWKRKGWDIDEIIELTLKWHISTFNAKSLPIPNEWEEKVNYWISRMGYHFTFDYFACPRTVHSGGKAEFSWCIDNVGVAPIYRRHPFKIRLINENEEYIFDTGIDIREWMPGCNEQTAMLELPSNMKPGHYRVQAGIMDDNISMIYFATDAPVAGAFYELGELEIVKNEGESL